MTTDKAFDFDDEYKAGLAQLGESFPLLYHGLPQELRDDESLLLKFIQIEKSSYWSASEHLRSKPEIFLLAITSCVEDGDYDEDPDSWLKSVPNCIKNNLEVQLKALELDAFAPLFASNDVLDHPAYIILLAEKYGYDHMGACLSENYRKKYGSPDDSDSVKFFVNEEQARGLYDRLLAEREANNLNAQAPEGKPSSKKNIKI